MWTVITFLLGAISGGLLVLVIMLVAVHGYVDGMIDGGRK